MPPLEEFLDTAPQYLYSDCPRKPIRTTNQRWTWLEYRPGSQYWRHGNGKRDVDDDAARRLSTAVLRALDKLPASKQRALEHRFGAAIRQLRSNDTAHGQEPDARLVLSLLLVAEPKHDARVLVEQLPRGMTDVLQRCTQRAMTTALARARMEPAAPTARELQGPRRAEYQAYLEHVADLWTKHFNVTVDDTGPDSICDQVYREAVSSMEQGDHDKRFVTSHDQIMSALVMETLTPVGNPFLHTLEMSTPGGDWGLNESNFVAVFGPAFSAISVGIGLFALSMYSQPAGHLAGGGHGNEELWLGDSWI